MKLTHLLVAAAILLPLSQPVSAKPKKVAKHGDWYVFCDRKKAECSLAQSVQTWSKRKIEISGFPIEPVAGNKAVAGFTISFPKDVFLGSGFTIAIDERNDRKYNYSMCNRSGCFAQIGLTKQVLAQYRGGVSAQIYYRMSSNRGNRYVAQFSLKGFSSAIEDVASRQEELSARRK